MPEPDETAPLLGSAEEGTVSHGSIERHTSDTAVVVSTSAKRTSTDYSLRRHSSACLPPFHEQHPSAEEPQTATTIYVVVPILLLGVFVANADGSLVIACSQKVASEFHALSDASWLVTSYLLAQSASQPLYGKLSDIFGRKANLVLSYVFFAAGCGLCGIGQAYWQVLTGRAISGIGGAGMTALVSIIIADLVPVRDVATWRAYVNVAATVGRSLGAPVGGWLTDTVGWRWAFLGQCPLTLLALVLVLWRLPNHIAKTENAEQSISEKIKRIDFVGAIFIAGTVSAFLLTLNFVSKQAEPLYIGVTGGVFVVLAVAFYVTEKFYAKEPILPIYLLTKWDALSMYLLVGVQSAGQYGFFYSIPVYSQIVSHSSVGLAGLRMVPSVIGNTVGGLASGKIISNTGRYKMLTTFASTSSTLAYFTVLMRWTGHTPWPEVLYIFFGGLGMGIITSTTFIHLAASLDSSEMAIAGTTLYLAQNVFMLVGIQLGTTIVNASLKAQLEAALTGVKHRSSLIKGLLSDASYVWSLPEKIQKIAVNAYINSLRYEFGELSIPRYVHFTK